MRTSSELRANVEVDRPRCVLIVEDDEGLRKLLEKKLRMAGYDASSVSTGTEALTIIQANPNQALLLDQNLPDTKGIDLINALIQRGLQVPFIVMTGQGDEQLAVEMMKLGADDYLVKDLALTDLLPKAFQRLFHKLDTERRLQAAEKALRESEKKYRELVENSNSIILRMDQDGFLLYFNEFAEKFFGYSKEEVLGRNVIGTTISAYDSQNRDMAAMIRDIALHPDRYITNEHENVLKDGRRVWVSWSNRVVVDESGEVQILCIGHDVTQRKQAEEALIQAKAQAEAASKAKSEFLANMSHEIRTPLNGIMGMMQLLRVTNLDVEQTQYVQLAITSANRLTCLLSDILDLSRVEAGKMEVHDREFCVEELGNSVAELFAVAARDKRMALKCVIDPSVPVRLIGDEVRVRQILFNIVGNALKFSESGAVHVRVLPLSPCRNGDLRLLFSVSDNGIGIPDEKLNDLFKPFVQVDGSYTRGYQGAGLGLAIVKRLVELLNGNVCVESVVGEGTSVHVALPFKLPAGAVLPDCLKKRQPSEPKQALRILLVEDEPTQALAIARLLGNSGHLVVQASDGKKAVDLFQAQDFDCILMDIQMPVLDGMAATMEIRRIESMTLTEGDGNGSNNRDKDRPSEVSAKSVKMTGRGSALRIPIIALTAHTMRGDREKFLKAGMDDYLAKPVMLEDLKMALQRVMVAVH